MRLGYLLVQIGARKVASRPVLIGHKQNVDAWRYCFGLGLDLGLDLGLHLGLVLFPYLRGLAQFNFPPLFFPGNKRSLSFRSFLGVPDVSTTLSSFLST